MPFGHSALFIFKCKREDNLANNDNQSVRHGFELFYLNNIDGRGYR